MIFLTVSTFVATLLGHPPAESKPIMPPVPAMQQESQQQAVESPAPTTSLEGQTVMTDQQLLALADNKYASGNLPLGDKRYVTTGAKKGYIYLCNARTDEQGGGAQANGPWIGSTTWNILNKISIGGSVSWPGAAFTNTVSGDSRTLAGNDLPTSHTTGIFPVQSTDPAYQYDRNPNTISAQTLKDVVAAHPVYSQTPYCMGGEVGVMLTGVALFNGFDATLRDAAAHEVQDSCEGHPQSKGEYHYHSLSSCFKDVSEKTVLGFALDGFPITGPKMAEGKYLTTEDLDECHGVTSEIVLDGKNTVTYHYVMTQDFPYSASCFRAKAINPSGIGQGMQGQQNTRMMPSGSPGMPQGGPPQEAITACSGKSQGVSCTFTTPRGMITGTCQTPPNGSLACVPAR